LQKLISELYIGLLTMRKLTQPESLQLYERCVPAAVRAPLQSLPL